MAFLIGDCYNVDETGFRIGIGREQPVITRESRCSLYFANSSNRALVSVMETVSRDGSALPPFIIIPGSLYMEDWYLKTSISDDSLIGVSETGYTNDILAMSWLEHFEKFSSRRQMGA